MRHKNIFFWGIILLAGLALLVYESVSRPEILRTPTPSPTVISTPESSATTIPNVQATSTPEKFESFAGLKAPASCLVAGEITYLDKQTYAASDNAMITWKNVDSTGRLIKWHIEPSDKLAVGPNLFANLDVPDGSWRLTVGLPTQPVAKEYTLSASITYGQLIKGNVEVKEVACAGTTKVKLNF